MGIFFRADFLVRVPPVAAFGTWQIGWVQACTKFESVETYGDLGSTSCEIPQLNSGIPVN